MHHATSAGTRRHRSAPGIEHCVEPATDATFFIQFYRTPHAPMVPGQVSADSRRRSGPWEHRRRDLGTTEEITEMVIRQYVDVVQDELLDQIPRSHRTKGTRSVLTYVSADINCPTCFNQVIETLNATPSVHTVDPHVADGCIAITHDLEESVLLATITTIGHTIDIAPNGEITMGQAHATTGRACDAHQPVTEKSNEKQ